MFLEIALVALVFLLVKWLAKSISYSAQIAEVTVLVLITYLLKRRNKGWKDLGFRRPDNWLKAAVSFVLCVVSIALIFNFVIQPLFPHGANEINNGRTISQGEFLFQLFVIGLGTAAIGEEMLMRGFVLNNLNELFGFNLLGTTLSVMIQAFLFGILHSGIQGMVSAGVIGLILAVFYIISGRNLWVVMAAHAVPDILSIISSYQNQ